MWISVQHCCNGLQLLVHILRNLQNAALGFEHEFFLLTQWLFLMKQACNLIKRAMSTACFLLLFGGRQANVRDLDPTGA